MKHLTRPRVGGFCADVPVRKLANIFETLLMRASQSKGGHMIRMPRLSPKRANPTRGTAPGTRTGSLRTACAIGAGNAASEPGLVDKFRDRDIAATARRGARKHAANRQKTWRRGNRSESRICDGARDRSPAT